MRRQRLDSLTLFRNGFFLLILSLIAHNSKAINSLNCTFEQTCPRSDILDTPKSAPDYQENCTLKTSNNCDLSVVFFTTSVTCPGSMDGSITVVIIDGTAPFEYIWNTGATTSSLSNLEEGIFYRLTVTDSDDCRAFGTALLVALGEPVEETLNTTLCSGEFISVGGEVFDEDNPSGTVNLSANSGNGCDSVLIVDLQFYPDAQGEVNSMLCVNENLTIGNQTFDEDMPSGSVTLPNASVNGCDSTVLVDLQFLQASQAMFSSVLCEGESITIGGQTFDEDMPSGSVTLPNASVNGCDSTIMVNLQFFPASQSIINQSLCSGETISVGGQTFDENSPIGVVTLSNASVNGCDSTIMVNLQFFPASQSIINQSLCSGETISVGGQTFDESTPNGSVTLQNASVNGCDSTIMVNLQFFPASQSIINQSLCSGETISVGGQTFDESTPSGSVTLHNANVNGCDSTIMVNLQFSPASQSIINQSLCSGETITVGGQTFDESTPSGSVTLHNASVNGCDSTIMVNLQFSPASQSIINQSLCSGETITVGGQTFDENNSSGVVILPNGSENGCDSTVLVNLQFSTPAQSAFNLFFCPGEAITIGGQVFDENNPSGIVTLPNASASGCDSTISVNLQFSSGGLSEFMATLCSNETITIGSETFDENNPTGNVILPGASTNGCDSVIIVNLQFSPAAQNTISEFLCSGETITIAGQTFDESNPGGEVIMPNASVNGCDSIVLVQLEYSTLSLELYSENDFGGYGISCAAAADGGIQALVNGGTSPFIYAWNTGDNTPQIDGLNAGHYSLSITDSDGCVMVQELALESPDPLEIFAVGMIKDCGEDAIQQIRLDSIKGGSGNYEYSIDEQFFFGAESFPVFVDLTESVNTAMLYVQDANDCLVEQSMDIPVPNILSVNLEATFDLQLGESILLSPELNFIPESWNWSPREGLNQPDELSTVATPDVTTTYILELSDEAGCSISSKVTIVVDKRSAIYIPNAFSPNGDGLNDKFLPYGGSSLALIERFEIYDRWGNQLFQEKMFPVNDPAYGWDGSFKGQPLNTGTFVYFVEVRLVNGETKIEKGSVVLHR